MPVANCTIPLAETQFEVAIMRGTSWVPVAAKAIMRLSPVPRVVIDVFDGPVGLDSGLWDPNGIVKLRLPVGREFEAKVVQLTIGVECRSRMIPTRQPVTVLQAANDLKCASFKVMNFPSLGSGTHPALLRAGGWMIRIEPVQDLRETRDVLLTDGGYALTHEGSVQRSDGKAFSPDDALKVVNALHLFLSFARGGSCGVSFIAGRTEDDKKVWEQWGSYATFPWATLSSWLDHRSDNADVLSETWPGFWRTLGKGGGVDDPILVALYWYLRSNESKNPYTAIVLAQAALERLARQLLPRSEYGKNRREFETIRGALQKARIETKMPSCCEALKGVERSWDGPKMLTKLRNDLVHSKSKQKVSLDAYVQAQDLGLWYVELMLLKLFGYQGRYANRIAYHHEGRWALEDVPWVKR